MGRLSEIEFRRRAAGIDWVLCDVDGVLTDGRLPYGAQGPTELVFHVADGLAIRLAQKAGLKLGVLSGRSTAALDRRAEELDLEVVLSGIEDKRLEFEAFLKRHETDAARVAFIGDDLPDLPVLGRCGLSFSPRDAAPEVQAAVHRILDANGGRGAVREMVELLLKARGDWPSLVAGFQPDP